MQLNEKILKFANALNLQIVECNGRAGLKYYKVLTGYCLIEIGRIDIDCSYEQFLENIAVGAVHEVDRLGRIYDDME